MKRNRTGDAERECFKELSNDFQQSWLGVTRDPPNQLLRRTYVRVSLSLIETSLSLFRQKARRRLLKKRSSAVPTLYFLGDDGYQLTKTGLLEPKNRGMKLSHGIPFTNHAAFILRSLAESFGVKVDFFGDQGWNDLTKAVDVRNRITHPKTKADLFVSDDDLMHVWNGYIWFWNVALLTTCSEFGITEIQTLDRFDKLPWHK